MRKTSLFDELDRLLSEDDSDTKATADNDTKDTSDKDEMTFKLRVAELMLLTNIASAGGPPKLAEKFSTITDMPDLNSEYWTIDLGVGTEVKKVTCSWSDEDIVTIAGGLAFPSKKDAIAAKNYIVANMKVVAVQKEVDKK